MDGVVINIAKPQEVVLTGDHPAFDKTPYARTNVRITVQRLSRGTIERLRRKHTAIRGRREVLDDPAFQTAIFVEAVRGWNFINADKEPVPCDDAMKQAVAQQDLDLLGAVLSTALSSSVIVETADEETARGN